MSRREIIECDRCGAIGDEHTDRMRRGRVFAATIAGTEKLGTMQAPADLCGDCMNELVTWFKAPATAGEKAVPA